MQSLVIIKYKRTKKKRTNGPNDARHVVWAHFFPLNPLPTSYLSESFVVGVAATAAAVAVTVVVVVVMWPCLVLVVSKNT